MPGALARRSDVLQLLGMAVALHGMGRMPLGEGWAKVSICTEWSWGGRSIGTVSVYSGRLSRVIVVVLIAVLTSRSAHADCVSGVIGVEPAIGDTLVPAFECRGQGTDICCRRHDNYRLRYGTDRATMRIHLPRRLFVMSAGVNGPNIGDIVYGPRDLVVATMDPDRPIPYRYDFEPPIFLPSPGTYAFVIQDGSRHRRV